VDGRSTSLACGDSVVLKPRGLVEPDIPRMGELALEPMGPAGVLNIVCGRARPSAMPWRVTQTSTSSPSRAQGQPVAGHDPARRISSAGADGTRGKSPDIVVFDDADLDEAVAGAAFGIYYMTRARHCNAGSRVLLQRSIYR